MPVRAFDTGCTICGDWGSDKLADRRFCTACGIQINLETARRLRMRDDAKDAAGQAEFKAWADEARFTLSDPDVLSAYEGARNADDALALAEARYRSAVRAAQEAAPRTFLRATGEISEPCVTETERARDEARDAWRQASDTQSDARALVRRMEKTARERFRAEREQPCEENPKDD